MRSLLTLKNLFYHLGISTIAKSTIAYKNKNTDYRIFEEIFKHIPEVATIHEAKIHDIRFAYELSEKLPSESILCFDYEYITNNMQLSGSSIAKIYKARWDIELFFKWIKQNLKIKTFFGTSKNAVMTQIWVAMIYYLLLAYVKFQGKYSYSLLELSRIIKTTVLDKINLIDLMSLNSENYRKLAFDEAQQHLF